MIAKTLELQLEITPQQVEQRCGLYSASYGVWSLQGLRLGYHMRVFAKEFMEKFLCDRHTCGIVIANDSRHNHIEICQVCQVFS